MDANNGTTPSADATNATTTTTAPAAPAGPSKAELRAAELKTRREAKAAAKEARKVELAEKRANGIIGTLKAALDTANGTTRNEILETLKAKFPDRDAVGMSVTVGIQLSRLAKTTGRKIISAKVEGRGRVYGFNDKVVFPQATLTSSEAGPVAGDSTPETRTNPEAGPVNPTPVTINETLSSIGDEVVASAATTEPTPEPTPEPAPAKGKNSGGKKNTGGKGKGK